MKTCSKCKTEKPFEAFHRNKARPDGYLSSCIECNKLRALELKKNPLMQLEGQIRTSVFLENKLLQRENKKLCKRCKEIFLIDDLLSGVVCKECSIEYGKEYYEKNKEKIKETTKGYRKKNKEKIRESKRLYREKTKEKTKECSKKYYGKNKEKIRERTREYYEKKYKEKMIEYNKEYYEKNKEKIREYQREYRLKKKLELQNNT